MDKLLIEGGAVLRGEVAISGAKNAALPILCAALLSAEPLELSNVPELNDIVTMLRLLEEMGVKIQRDGHRVTLDASQISKPVASYERVKTMRASILHTDLSITTDERDVPTLAADEVLVQVGAVGVCGSDVHYYKHGRIGDFVVDKDIILGHELGGRIVAKQEGEQMHFIVEIPFEAAS